MPKATITRRVSRVQAFGDNAHGLRAARRIQETLTTADVVVAVLDGSRRTIQERLQALLPIDQRAQRSSGYALRSRTGSEWIRKRTNSATSAIAITSRSRLSGYTAASLKCDAMHTLPAPLRDAYPHRDRI